MNAESQCCSRQPARGVAVADNDAEVEAEAEEPTLLARRRRAATSAKPPLLLLAPEPAAPLHERLRRGGGPVCSKTIWPQSRQRAVCSSPCRSTIRAVTPRIHAAYAEGETERVCRSASWNQLSEKASRESVERPRPLGVSPTSAVQSRSSARLQVTTSGSRSEARTLTR